MVDHWTIKLGIQMANCNKSFQSFVFVLTQLHFRQWSSLPFCLPSLIVQWPARFFEVLANVHDCGTMWKYFNWHDHISLAAL